MEDDLNASCCGQAECCAPVDASLQDAAAYNTATPDWTADYASPVQDWPYESRRDNGSIYLSNIKFLLSTWDAAGFRVTANNNVEFLVRDEQTQRLRWVDVRDMPVIPKAK